MSIVIGVIEEGLIYAIMALGLYITYKILDFPLFFQRFRLVSLSKNGEKTGIHTFFTRQIRSKLAAYQKILHVKALEMPYFIRI